MTSATHLATYALNVVAPLPDGATLPAMEVLGDPRFEVVRFDVSRERREGGPLFSREVDSGGRDFDVDPHHKASRFLWRWLGTIARIVERDLDADLQGVRSSQLTGEGRRVPPTVGMRPARARAAGDLDADAVDDHRDRSCGLNPRHCCGVVALTRYGAPVEPENRQAVRAELALDAAGHL